MSSSTDKAIVVENVAKYYPIHLYRVKNKNTTETPSSRFDSFKRFVALKDISFEVAQAEAVGIIGNNGAGKSTLLRLLAGVSRPSEGQVHVNGKISTMFSVGTGMQSELTGRENIYLYGALQGYSPAFIKRHLDDIINFAGIGEFIDLPMATYSSGMRARLAFSAAIIIDNDILLIDEVLAVGDAAFKANALNRMRQHFEQGRTIVYVSHNTGILKQLCSKIIWIDQGRVRAIGAPDEIIPMYDTMQSSGFVDQILDYPQIGDVRITNHKGEQKTRFHLTQPIHVHFNYRNLSKLPDPQIRLFLFDVALQKNVAVFESSQAMKNSVLGDSGQIHTVFRNINLHPGHYYIRITLYEEREDTPVFVHHTMHYDFLAFDPNDPVKDTQISPGKMELVEDEV